jgi:hypothetical protein
LTKKGKSWKATLNVETEAEAAEVIATMSEGWEFKNGNLHTTSHVLPGIITDPRSGREVFFNQVRVRVMGGEYFVRTKHQNKGVCPCFA